MSPQSKVVELMINDPPEWNMELIRNIFFNDESKAITTIPLNLADRADRQTWKFTWNDFHSVRSAYHLHRQVKARNFKLIQRK